MTLFQYNTNRSPFGGIVPLILIIALFFGLFWVAGQLYTWLSVAAPFLLIIALFLDYKVVINYGKYIIGLFQKNAVMAVLMVLLTFFGFPLVSLFLLFKAYTSYKLKGMLEKKNEYTQYEEVQEDDDFLELPDLNKQKSKQSNSTSSDYEQLFN